MRDYHLMGTQACLNDLKTSGQGLSEEEASKRLKEHGANTLKKQKKGGALRLFFAQFKDIMTILLICAAAISAGISFITRDRGELVDTGILLFIILLNTFVGFIQQYRADTAIEKLKSLSICEVKTLRGGRTQMVGSEDIVPGDIVYLEEGNMVPADCRILECDALKCDESALTGESQGVKKNADILSDKKTSLGDRKNMLFSSTFVVGGQAKALVVGTGQNTEIGKIADLIDNAEAVMTPLEKILSVLGKIITAFVVSVAAVIFIFGLFFKDGGILGNFMAAVAVAVAAIPEGMPAVVTVIMALGVQKMSRERAVVRKLHAVETLGGCNYICSDKTGTLTENKMTVEEIWTDFTASETADKNKPVHRTLLACMAVCNSVKADGDKLLGDPTETALVNFAKKWDHTAEGYRHLGTVPFNSERKMMSVAAEKEYPLCYVKGGADIVLKKCTRILTSSGVRALTLSDRHAISDAMQNMAKRALRVLGFACREYEKEIFEEDLIFVGLCGMIDPPKQGVAQAVRECRRAGITTVMITGDHPDTAFAIAKRLTIAQNESEVITGAEIDAMAESAFFESIAQYKVFARVSPKHKTMIVRALQKKDNVVAMTGDGINDAPSIRTADIGIAMGVSGTDVTKSASDMVITDDNFTTIVTAVREGRRVFSNIKKTIQFFLATNLAEVLCILAVTLVLYRFDFLTSTQLLWINLITDSLPVLALGAEGADRDVMERPPRRASEIFAAPSVVSMLFFGAVQALIVILAFIYCVNAYGNAVAVTVTFFVLSFLELFHSFNIRSDVESTFGKGFFSNKMMFLTVFIGIAVNMILCFVPVFRAAFGIVQLTAIQWLFVFAASLAIIPVGELYKFVVRRLRPAQPAERLRKTQRVTSL